MEKKDARKLTPKELEMVCGAKGEEQNIVDQDNSAVSIMDIIPFKDGILHNKNDLKDGTGALQIENAIKRAEFGAKKKKGNFGQGD